MSYSNNLLINGNFDTDLSSWTTIANNVTWNSDGGSMNIARVDANESAKQEILLSSGFYRITGSGKHIANNGTGQIVVFNQSLTTEISDYVTWTNVEASYTEKSDDFQITTPGVYAVVFSVANTANATFRWTSVSLQKKSQGAFLAFI